MLKIAKATKDAAEREGKEYGAPGHRGRRRRCSRPAGPARLRGAGFYDYDETGKPRLDLAGPGRAVPGRREAAPAEDIKDRMLFAEALETAKCFEEGVIESSAAANIGSIMGIGFPPMTGGAAQFMAGYQDPATPTARSGWPRSWSVPTSSPRPTALASRPPPWLRDLAATGGSFPA